MKRFAYVVLALVCMATGVAYCIDLSQNIDITTNFVLNGALWVRYAIAGGVLLLLLLASFMAPRHPAAFAKRSIGQGFCAILCGLGFAATGGVLLLDISVPIGLPDVTAIAYLVTACWMILLGISRFAQTLEAPTQSALVGILGTFSLFLLCVDRTCTNPTGLVRISNHLYGFAALVALLFCAAQLKIAYVPGGKSGWWVFFTGMASFLLCTCLALPDALYRYWLSTLSLAGLMPHVALGLVGLCGLVWAFGAVGRPLKDDEAPQYDVPEWQLEET